jgi:hypothetical protein
MISIYQAANLADAHLIRHLLEQERIDCYIAGEYLQGALGEIPANTPIEVRVAPEDAARARRIVEEWESSEPDPTLFGDASDGAADGMRTSVENTRKSRFSGLAWSICGAAIGAGLVWAAYNGPRNEDGIDYDGDGALEERWIFADGRLVRIEMDRNRDEKMDVIAHYDRRGSLERDESDNNFDGKMEERGEYIKGLPVLFKTDRDLNGGTDYRIEYLQGVIFREEWLDASGNVVKRIEYRGGEPFRGEIDRDGDGRLDTERDYDHRGEIVGSKPLAAG